MMASKIKYILLFVFFGLEGFSDAKLEPSCSKYHFEEMVLEKVIRMELSTGQMMDDFKKLAVEVKQDINDMKQMFEKVKTEVENERETMAADKKIYENKIAKLEEQINRPVYTFSARTVTNTSPTANEKLIFKDVLLNEADVYDASTGIFIAPVNGTFAFTSSLCTHKNKYFAFQIMADDKILNREYNKEHTDASSVSAYVVAVLKAGAKVWVEVHYTASGGIYQQSDGMYCWNRFSGHIL